MGSDAFLTAGSGDPGRAGRVVPEQKINLASMVPESEPMTINALLQSVHHDVLTQAPVVDPERFDRMHKRTATTALGHREHPETNGANVRADVEQHPIRRQLAGERMHHLWLVETTPEDLALLLLVGLENHLVVPDAPDSLAPRAVSKRSQAPVDPRTYPDPPGNRSRQPPRHPSHRAAQRAQRALRRRQGIMVGAQRR